MFSDAATVDAARQRGHASRKGETKTVAHVATHPRVSQPSVTSFDYDENDRLQWSRGFFPSKRLDKAVARIWRNGLLGIGAPDF